ncbi:MAG: DUF4416 family protein [Spirochaetaceae bacterium]|nr:DUF4416 family protein [Spirochaetaceae bacterium]
MAQTQPFIKEKLICGLLFKDDNLGRQAKDALINRFGPCDYQSEVMPFHFSSYYNAEMGAGIKRQFIAFEMLYDPSLLANIKIQSNSFEEALALNGRRQVNIDPGFIAGGHLILATTKASGHRIALNAGIYGELTLFYSRKAFQPLPWTYPDFKSDEIKECMTQIRSMYRRQLKRQIQEPG